MILDDRITNGLSFFTNADGLIERKSNECHAVGYRNLSFKFYPVMYASVGIRQPSPMV